jgi:uncharacterized protein (DUF1697 family)
VGPKKPSISRGALTIRGRSFSVNCDECQAEYGQEMWTHNFLKSFVRLKALFPVSSCILHNPDMALVAFLRGVNVGGHKTFRPKLLAQELSDYDVVNIGAAGTFVIRKPGSRAKFRAALLRKLPFETEVVLCDGRDLLRLEADNPFTAEPSGPDVVRFVSILSKAGGLRASLPVMFPPDGEWLVRVMASEGQFVFGMYRRHMKTIGYLGQLDKLFGVPATTRNWNTIIAIAKVLKTSQGRGTS